MKRVLAIAALTFRAAVRSRVFTVLTALLLIAVIGLPLTIRGDGTAAGHAQILLSYTLGAATLLLSIASVWLGCAAVSQEVRDRQIHLLIVKPVRPIEIWIGKWLGLAAMNVALLLLSGGLAYALLLWATRPEILGADEQARLAEEILVARATARPEETAFERETREAFRKQMAEGAAPVEGPPEEAYRAFRQLRRAQFYSVPPGAIRQWRFRLPVAADERRPVFLRFRFAKSQLAPDAVAGQWFFVAGDEVRLSTAGAWPPDAFHSLPLPAAPFLGQREIVVAFGNADPSGATVLFDPDRGLEVLMRAGGFGGNFLRAGLVLFVQLGFLSALGLAAGSVFSLPVASFVSIAACLLLQLSGYIGNLASQRNYFYDTGRAGPATMIADRVLNVVFRALRAAVSPLELPDALGMLAEGRLLTWGAVGAAAVVHLVVFGGLLALAGAGALRRRELGLPS